MNDKATKSTTTVEKDIDRSMPKDIADTIYVRGPKAYNPRATHNKVQWEKIDKHLTKAGDKGVAGRILAKALAHHDSRANQTHYNFVSYLCGKCQCLKVKGK